MNRKKVLPLILNVDKGLWKYWDGMQNIFNTDMKLFIREMELCDDIIEKLIGYQYSGEENICSDPIIETIYDYDSDKININEAMKSLISIETILKDEKFYHEFNDENIIIDITNLYLYIKETNDLLVRFFGADELSFFEEVIKLQEIINYIFEIDIDFDEDDILVNFINRELNFNNVEIVKEKVKKLYEMID
jgi:hypothetical protein